MQSTTIEVQIAALDDYKHFDKDKDEDFKKNGHNKDQWHFHYCGIPDGYEEMETEGGDKGVIVAVIDSGVDYEHEDLKDNMWVNTKETPDNGIDDDGNGYIDDYYGVDSKTNNYVSSNGYFVCKDETGNLAPVVYDWTTTSKMVGSEHSYLALPNDHGWTFNRYFLGLTHVSLKPNVSGVGYKGYFVSNPAVCAALSETDTFGYSLSLEGGLSVTRSIDGYTSGRIVTLRVDNFDVQNYGEAMLSAKVFVTLKDGTVLESSEVSMSMRMILEDISARAASFTAEQLAAVKAMIEKYPVVKEWDTKNLYA